MPPYYFNVNAVCFANSLGNAASVDTLHLRIDTAGCSVMQIAQDGFYFNEEKVITEEGTVIYPGGTADWLVSCHQQGVYTVCRPTDNLMKRTGVNRMALLVCFLLFGVECEIKF